MLSLVREDSTCLRATKPMSHSYSLCSATRGAITMRSRCSPQLEKAQLQQQRLSAAKNELI